MNKFLPISSRSITTRDEKILNNSSCITLSQAITSLSSKCLIIYTECSVIRVFKRSFSFRKSSVVTLVGLSAIFTNRLSTVSGVVTVRHSGHDLFLKKRTNIHF